MRGEPTRGRGWSRGYRPSPGWAEFMAPVRVQDERLPFGQFRPMGTATGNLDTGVGDVLHEIRAKFTPWDKANNGVHRCRAASSRRARICQPRFAVTLQGGKSGVIRSHRTDAMGDFGTVNPGLTMRPRSSHAWA